MCKISLLTLLVSIPLNLVVHAILRKRDDNIHPSINLSIVSRLSSSHSSWTTPCVNDSRYICTQQAPSYAFLIGHHASDRGIGKLIPLSSLNTLDSQLGHTTNEDELVSLVSNNICNSEKSDPQGDRLKRFPESATVPIRAPRYINRKVPTRHKYSPIAKAQGLPHDDTKATQYAFSKHLHICGGAIRGRRLCVPPVYLRPMMNRVKNALFPSLKHMGLFAYGYDCKVIDLFCGSGSVGLEALSYGASHCTFVDLSIQCCKATSINAAHCKFEDKVRIIRADALESISSPWLHSITDKFDLLFACPPYEEVVYKDLMKQLANTTILNTNGVVVVEYPREIDYLPWNIEDGKLLGYRNRKYGRTVVAIYCYKPTGSLLESCEKSKDEFVPTTYSRKRLKIEGYIPKENPNNYT